MGRRRRIDSSSSSTSEDSEARRLRSRKRLKKEKKKLKKESKKKRRRSKSPTTKPVEGRNRRCRPRVATHGDSALPGTVRATAAAVCWERSHGASKKGPLTGLQRAHRDEEEDRPRPAPMPEEWAPGACTDALGLVRETS